MSTDNEPTPPLPFRLINTADGPTVVAVPGQDLTAIARRIEVVVDVDTGERSATVTIDADVDVNFPLEVTVVKSGASFLEDLDAAELNAVLAGGSMASNQGARILAHLRARAGMAPQ